MNFKSFQIRLTVFTIAFICFFYANLTAQTIKAEKSESGTTSILDKVEETGLVRKRVVRSDSVAKTNSVIPTAKKISDFEKQAFDLINQKRAEIGLQTLIWSEEVAKIARLHSENMAKYDFFSHRGIDGKMVNDRADSLGITKWTALGENIAFNRGYQKPVECAVEKWIESPGHRENLLNNRWKESAIGIAVTVDGTFYFTQVFLKRK